MKNSYYAFLVNDLVEAALIKNAEYEAEQPLTLYKKYRRRDVLRLLNWQEQMVDQNIGGYTYKDGKFVIFMTLEKGENFKGARMAYEDTIIDPQHILYYTKSPRTINSPEVKYYLNQLTGKFICLSKNQMMREQISILWELSIQFERRFMSL